MDKIPRQSEEDGERQSYDGPPRWLIIVCAVILAVGFLYFLLTIFAQVRE